MQRHNVLLAVVLVATGVAITAATRDTGGTPFDAKAAFAQLKQLEGVWETRAADGKVARTEFELTANRTVLLERYSNAALPGGVTVLVGPMYSS